MINTNTGIFALIFAALSVCGNVLCAQGLVTYQEDNSGFEQLDEDYNIHISSALFESLKAQYPKEIPENGLSYGDSLGYVLAHKHKGYNLKYRGEMLRATYSLERVGYYLYVDEAEAEALRQQLGVKTPYDVVQYFKDGTKTSPIKDQYLERLKKKCLEKTGDSTAYAQQDPAKLLKYAFRLGAEARLIAYRKENEMKHDKKGK